MAYWSLDKRREIQAIVQEYTTLDAPRFCGRIPRGPWWFVLDRTHRYILRRSMPVCKSVKFCPMCHFPIQERKRRESALAARRWAERGRPGVFGTLTMSHTVEDSLVDLRTEFYRRWRLAIQCRAWSKLRAKYGIDSTEWNQETTWGPEAGWHPHRHFLLFPHLGADLNQMRADIQAHFEKYFPGEFAVDIQIADSPEAVSKYITKTQNRTYTEGHYGRDPLTFLEEFRRTGDKFWMDLWIEYEQGMKGARTYCWSGKKELFDELGITEADLLGNLPEDHDHESGETLIKAMAPERINPDIFRIPGILDEGVQTEDFGRLLVINSEWWLGPPGGIDIDPDRTAGTSMPVPDRQQSVTV